MYCMGFGGLRENRRINGPWGPSDGLIYDLLTDRMRHVKRLGGRREVSLWR